MHQCDDYMSIFVIINLFYSNDYRLVVCIKKYIYIVLQKLSIYMAKKINKRKRKSKLANLEHINM